MTIVCLSLGNLVTDMLTLSFGSFKTNWGHEQSLGLWHTMSEIGTPSPHNSGMVIILVARNTQDREKEYAAMGTSYNNCGLIWIYK